MVRQKDNLAEIDGEFEENRGTIDGDVMELHKSVVCWNCGMNGHIYKDCLKDKTVFCYGCGLKDAYKPTCSRCHGSGNLRKDVPRQQRGHPHH